MFVRIDVKEIAVFFVCFFLLHQEVCGSAVYFCLFELSKKKKKRK